MKNAKQTKKAHGAEPVYTKTHVTFTCWCGFKLEAPLNDSAAIKNFISASVKHITEAA